MIVTVTLNPAVDEEFVVPGISAGWLVPVPEMPSEPRREGH